MRIALFGSTGMVGSRIAQEALDRGHQVSGFARTTSAGAPEGVEQVVGDLADPSVVREAARNHDVIVSATGPSRTGESHDRWLDAVRTLLAHAGDTRILFVGGAGSLRLPDGTRLLDSPDFPEDYKPEATTGAEALRLFHETGDNADWTYLSPAPMIAPGERTGRYASALDEPAGESISAEDYAVAILDELETPQHRGRRFTVAN